MNTIGSNVGRLHSAYTFLRVLYGLHGPFVGELSHRNGACSLTVDQQTNPTAIQNTKNSSHVLSRLIHVHTAYSHEEPPNQ
jgi:hypothetical protein